LTPWCHSIGLNVALAGSLAPPYPAMGHIVTQPVEMGNTIFIFPQAAGGYQYFQIRVYKAI
jgi:hypothetical protein